MRVAIAVVLLLTLAAAPAAGGTADRPAIGYRIAADGTAAGVWLGARHVASGLGYRIDPGARPSTPGFAPVRRLRDLDGSGVRAVTRREVTRAAYLLSAYGSRRGHRAQNAAVEVAVDDLLVGGRHARRGSRTLARIRQTGADAVEIRYLADYMLRDAQQYAGPYHIAISRRGATLGGTAALSVRVTASSGAPFATLPVTVQVPGKTARRAETDGSGRAAFTWSATRAGLLDVVVRVAELPEARLLVRSPLRRGASRVALAGIKRTVARHVRVPIRAIPTVTLQPAAPTLVGAETTGTITVTDGIDLPRPATYTLYGPFPTQAEASCTGTPYRTTSGSVSADGDYAVPATVIDATGYYAWGVHVDGNLLNTEASACGQPFVARVKPWAAVKVLVSQVRVGGQLRAYWSVGRLPDPYAGTVTVRLFGPFASREDVRCTGPGRTTTFPVTGPDHGATPLFSPRNPGILAWRASVSASEFSLWSASRCGGPGTLVRVSP
jgi:hypothetical protein